MQLPATPGRTPLRQIMTPDVVCVRPDLSVAEVVRLMISHHIGCVPVVDARRRPIGMITKFDIVEQLEAFMRSASSGSPVPLELAARTADELMMPLAITLEDNATVAHASRMMTTEDLHHVIVVDQGGILVGVVSTKDITRWIDENDRRSEEITS